MMLHEHVHHVAIITDPLRELRDTPTSLRIRVRVLIAILRNSDSIQDMLQVCCLKNLPSLL